jgi:hypothetical protein
MLLAVRHAGCRLTRRVRAGRPQAASGFSRLYPPRNAAAPGSPAGAASDDAALFARVLRAAHAAAAAEQGERRPRGALRRPASAGRLRAGGGAEAWDGGAGGGAGASASGARAATWGSPGLAVELGRLGLSSAEASPRIAERRPVGGGPLTQPKDSIVWASGVQGGAAVRRLGTRAPVVGACGRG